MVLADMGADVIKIEPPFPGDYLRVTPPLLGEMSGRFLALNRDKRSVVLDLKDERHAGAFLRMVKQADVVVESFRPGVLSRLGLDFEALRQQRADIILCSISGYGQDGPYRDRAGHDLNYVGIAGVLAMGGDASGAPALPGVPIGDLSGALWGLGGVLGALVGRERGLGGAHLDISMTEGALALLAAEIGNLDCASKVPTRGTEALNGGLAAYRVYRTKDQRYVSVGALEPKFWERFNRAIGRAGNAAEIFAGPGEQERIADEVQERIATRTQSEWRSIFDAADCCADVILELDELGAHPQHQARGVFFPLSTPAGPATQVRLPLGQPKGERHAPRHGEHTEEVLTEMGFTGVELADLLAAAPGRDGR